MDEKQTERTVRKYAQALIDRDESTLNDMTAGQKGQPGGVGSGSNRLQQLHSFGVSGIGNILTRQNEATVQFSSGTDIPCIGVFEVQDERHVQANWKLYTLSRQ
jgi:hypothetical protein